MKHLPAALAPLAEYRQFILWKSVPLPSGKVDKRPVNHNTGLVMTKEDNWQQSPATWTDAGTALALAEKLGPSFGVGFFFTADDPFFFLDMDNALGADNKWSPLAVKLCETFKGSAVEVSQSGKGLHVFGTGKYAPHRILPIAKEPFEFYTEKRFAALTGVGAQGSADFQPQAAIDWLITNYLPPKPATLSSADWTDEPCEGYGGPENDVALIEKMLASRSVGAAFGGRASIQQLWTADEDALGASYPDPRGFDRSSADAALCQHLAFWTGKNCERIDRLFRLSGLYREKWESRPDYRQRTIGHAVSHCANVYAARKAPSPPPTAKQAEVAANNGVTLKSGYQYLARDQQMELFKGCVYVQNLHRVFTPDGSLLKPEQFRATYGGYEFALDDSNTKKTKNAWEVFTESQAVRFPRAHDVCFRPELPSGSLVEEESRVLLNTYVPINTRRVDGCPAPFLDLLGKLFPIEKDYAIILAYMAACVQYPGHKFRWAPLIQGAPGNGKTTLLHCVSFGVGRRYTHPPQAHDLGNKFNDWICGNLFIPVSDIYVPDHKVEVMEVLKPLITDSYIGVQGKGAQQAGAENYANFMLCSNYKDAIRKHTSDRRFCIFYTPQQSAQDIIDQGAGGSYFPDLYEWLDADGYAIVNNYLQAHVIPDELNPSTRCHIAPTTSSTAEAVVMSRGGVEQELSEAIEEERAGFKGGWVSSFAFDRLIADRRDTKRITHHKRRELLQEVGYDWHPGLTGGRVNNPIPFENGKPRLYIKNGHPASNLTEAANIAKHYLAAQEYILTSDGSGIKEVTK